MQFKTHKRRGTGIAERPERTREHYIEALSRNHVERFILLRGHVVNEPRPDYGYDLVVTTFDYENDSSYRRGVIENGQIFIQLKATDHLDVLEDGQTISFPIKRKHAIFWQSEPFPVILIVYSVKEGVAYWLHMQPYFEAATFVMPPNTQQELSVHLSKQAIVNERAIDAFRQLKQTVLRQIEELRLYAPQ